MPLASAVATPARTSSVAAPAAAAPREPVPFAQHAAARAHLVARWGLLHQEGRLGQLAWEAELLCSREPELCTLANGVPLEALLVCGRPALAAALAGKVLHRATGDAERQRWIMLQRRAASLCRQAAPRPALPHCRRLVVASAFCGEAYQHDLRPARENHERWCALHGYEYSCLTENVAGREDPTWSKLLHVLELLRAGSEHVFWMDADSLFVNDGADLEWLCALQKDFVFAGDLNTVFNAGHFLARRCDWVEWLLQEAFRIYPWPEWEDNGALMIMLGGGLASEPATWRTAFERMKVPTRSQEECNRATKDSLGPGVADHVKIVPQHRINSYEWPGGGGLLALARGDPILHFAGCSAAEKVGLVACYAPQRGDPSLLLSLCRSAVPPTG